MHGPRAFFRPSVSGADERKGKSKNCCRNEDVGPRLQLRPSARRSSEVGHSFNDVSKTSELPFNLLLLPFSHYWPSGPPSMKVKKLQKFGNKSGLMGCKCSSLNASGTENPLSHLLLGSEKLPFPIIGPLW